MSSCSRVTAIVDTAEPTANSVQAPLPAAAAAMQEQDNQLGLESTGTYNLLTNSCATHCASILRAGGIDVGATTMQFVRWLKSQTQ